MKVWHEGTWPIITIISAAVAVISAVIMVLSAFGGSTINAIISAASFILFAACAAEALVIRSKISKIENADEEVRCMRLKKAGVERCDNEIVPKGKMPQE